MSKTAQAKKRSLSLLEDIFTGYAGPAFEIQFWDDSTWRSGPSLPKFTLELNHPGALKKMFLPPTELSLGEAYIYQDFNLKGDVFRALEIADHIQTKDRSLLDKLEYTWKLWSLPEDGRVSHRDESAQMRGEKHSIERDRQAISYHYDVSNAFYKLWLDDNLLYSCAYFADDGYDIHQAQEHKMDYICKKLRLQPGDTLLDIGCGWGGQIIHAAKRYGVDALGITLSENQVQYARKRIQEEGVEGKCRVELTDYREIPSGTTFDKIVSVGMIEHVGEEKYPAYFDQAFRLLDKGGLFLNHGIAATFDDPNRGQNDNTFSDKYVFPDGELTLISTTLKYAEAAGFEVRDVESLREHYAKTLRHWVKRLEARHQEALQHVEETTYRIWRLYMAASARGFEVGRLNIYQSLLGKQTETGEVDIPRTRMDLYN